MSQRRSQAQGPLLTQEQLKKKLEVTNFDPNAILRGAQLTVVGGVYLDGTPQVQFTDNNQALRALQNPALFTSEHYKQAVLAVAIGIAIRIAISIPVRMPQIGWHIGADVVLDYWHQDIALVPLVHIQF